MKQCITGMICAGVLILLFNSCKNSPGTSSSDSNEEMVNILTELSDNNYDVSNPFASAAKMEYFQIAISRSTNLQDSSSWQFLMSNTFLELGEEPNAVEIGERLVDRVSILGQAPAQLAKKSLAMAYLRLGERENCINDHTGASCIFPIEGRGVQMNKTNTEKAILLYEEVLKENPADAESKWLLNIGYMAIGKYPKHVPPAFLIKGLDTYGDVKVKPFTDVAMHTGLNVKNMAGGSIVDDFDNDGYFDIVTSGWGLNEGMHFNKNNGNGTFTDRSSESGLSDFTGGLNILQTDYNNDGLKDIFVLRGGWMKAFGNQPNSLLKNNGDGTFTDVTKQSGLLSYHPTQTATWADFNNDGWLDVFIGNETTVGKDNHPCELYINNQDGTFSEMAKAAGIEIALYVKGVTSGDYDNDNRIDIFISTLDGNKFLLRNESDGGTVKFRDVTQQAGIDNKGKTFTTWFWDYDNDGWMDILAASYEYEKSLAWYAGQDALKQPFGSLGKLFIFHNNHNGSFEEISDNLGLNQTVFSMGANFGDINNDGFLDMYLGTGNPVYQSLVPNKMFLNMNGKRFADVTSSARVGNLQKGHGVSFADMDNDGDEDIYIEMGGAYTGDAYENSLYDNPGQSDNHWINLSLEGIKANRAAIGAKIKVTFTDGGVARSVYRELNSGGSFGSNPLQQHIGIGQARVISAVEIKWPGSNTVQVFENINADQNITVKEGSSPVVNAKLNKVDYVLTGKNIVDCPPM